MARTSCPSCGATIQVARLDQDGEVTAPLEIFTDASADADRYRIIGFEPLQAERVPDGAPGDFYPDHRHDCPGHNAGRR